MKCPVCFSPDCGSHIEVYDDRYGYPGRFQINKCRNCGHKFLQEDFTREILTRLYTDYYPRASFDLKQYQPNREVKGFSSWLNGGARLAYGWVPKKVCVLDIGCGFGETLGYHKARGCEVYGVEADENIRRVADKFGFNVHVGLFDPRLYKRDFFDYVTTDQVIEHMTDPVEALRGMAQVLKPGGLAILSTPNSNGWGSRVFGSKWINWHVPYHCQFFSEKSMKIAAEKAGLYLEKSKICTSSAWLNYQWCHLAFFPKMGRPSLFWAANRKLNTKEKIVIRLLSVFHRFRINHVITRLFDMIGIGDNYLFFLRKRS